MGSLLKPFRVPLDGISPFKRINFSTQLGAICKLAKGALNPTLYVINKDIVQYPSQYSSMRDTTSHQSPFGH